MAATKKKAKPATTKTKPAPTKTKPAPTKTKPAPTKTKAKPAPAARTRPDAPAEWQTVLDVLGGNPGITRKGMFGADGLGLAGKYFAMAWKGNLVAKLPRERVDALVAAGTGTAFDPGMGRPMREWVLVAPGAADWLALAEEALAFVAGLAR